MVHIRQPLPLNNDGSVDITAWMQSINIAKESTKLIQNACHLASIAGEDHITDNKKNCFLQGLEIAEILTDLGMDTESITTAIIYSTVKYTDLTINDINEQLGHRISKLIKGVLQIDDIRRSRQNFVSPNQQQIDNIRKILLAMVSDVRVVVIKLAEILSNMRAIRYYPTNIKKRIAKEAIDIFAPLANRLGLHSIKWELEDLAFFTLEPDTYKEIAKKLAERRTERDHRVNKIVTQLKQALSNAKIEAKVYGRAKHIYSIRRKMLRKQVNFTEIYDAIAVRILLPTITDCYTSLSISHELWQPIPEEFDDYITTPKSNGYRSIHTAVIDENGKNFEIQIRTQQMHEEAEKGIAAHWMYKEGKRQTTSYEEKIDCLRQLLEWQKELTHNKKLPDVLEKNVFENRVYVFTPAGDIIDLPSDSTPLDFAYHIHTEVGHRCRGAKANGKIVNLTYKLHTGDTIEILTTKKNNPSQDWIITSRGYLKTSSARAKVLHWFKQQDFKVHLDEGKSTLERELERLDIHHVDYSDVANKLNYKSADTMLAALGNGNLRLAQIINLIHIDIEPSLPIKSQPFIHIPTKTHSQSIKISGISNLLSYIAKCCKPIPGDQVIGYVTQNKGISIHHRNCKNIIYAENTHPERLIEIEWNATTQKTYPVDIEILAYDRHELIRDVTTVLANHKINITQINTNSTKKSHQVKIIITVEIDNLEILTKLLDNLNQLPTIHLVRRIRQHD